MNPTEFIKETQIDDQEFRSLTSRFTAFRRYETIKKQPKVMLFTVVSTFITNFYHQIEGLTHMPSYTVNSEQKALNKELSQLSPLILWSDSTLVGLNFD